MKKHWIILVLFTLLFGVVITLAFADGTESLGPPSIDIESGNGMVAAGTGMVTGSGTIEVSVPTEVTIKQVLLYWEGKMDADLPGDNTIVVNGTEVTGKLIGGPTLDFPGAYSSSFRADITNLGLVASGDTALTLEGLNFSHVNDGAGVLVLYEDSGLVDADIELFDGLDLAFQGWPEPQRSTTEPQTFKFKASTKEREAQLSMFIASTVGAASGGGSPRPNSIEVTIDGITEVFSDYLDSNDGDEWDTVILPITIPENADSLTVQAFSRDDNDTGNLPASLSWIAAGLMVPGNGNTNLKVSKICTSDVFVGDEIEYKITVSNTGDEILTDVEVTDSLLGTVAKIDSLAVGASSTITKTMIAAEAGLITNMAWATGTIASSPEPVKSNTAECQTTRHPMVVTKDAQTSLVRRYNWEINKTVNGEKSFNLFVFPTQVVSPTYDVKVGLGDPAYFDSDWVVSGTISITNPAPMDATLSAVTDVIPDFSFYLPVISKVGDTQNVGADQKQHINSAPPGISAPVECPSLTVPAGGTLVCTYGPVDLSSGLTRTNTAFAELKNTVGGVFSGTTVFSGTAQIDFEKADISKLIDEEVEVDDQQEGEDGKRILGTANVNDDELPKSFVYKQGMPSFSTEECMVPETRMKEVPNTATFTTNDTGTMDNSSATVNLFCIESASTGFEDLPIDRNDWDYNDAFVEVRFDDPYPTFSSSNDLLSTTFQFVQTVNISAFTHEFHIQPAVFACDGTYSLTRNGVAAVTNARYTSGQDLLIITDTGKPPNTAELVINFDVPSPGDCPLDLSGFDPFKTFHGEGLFYAPWLYVKNSNERIIPGDPRLLGVPDNWEWPDEGQAIWLDYPKVNKPNPPAQLFPTFTEFWWENE